MLQINSKSSAFCGNEMMAFYHSIKISHAFSSIFMPVVDCLTQASTFRIRDLGPGKGLKRKVAIKDENPYKRSRLVEGCSKEQTIGNEQLAGSKCLWIKRQLKLVDDHPSKKGKFGESNSDCHSSSNMKDVGCLRLKSEDAVGEEKISRKNRFSERRAIDQSYGTEPEADDDADFLCIKKRLKLDDDHQTKKEKKIGECTSAVVSTETGFNCSSFINVFGKSLREDDITYSVFCKRIK